MYIAPHGKHKNITSPNYHWTHTFNVLLS